MKKVKFLFYVVTLILLLWTAQLDIAFIQRLIPENPNLAYFSLVLFDGGMISWLMMYIYSATGTTRRMIALAMTIISMIGIAIISAAELLTESTGLITFDISKIGDITIIVIVGWTLMLLAATVIYHLADPEILTSIAVQDAKDEVTRVALDIVKKNAPQIAQSLAPTVAEQILSEMVSSVEGESQNKDFEFSISKHKAGTAKRQKQTHEEQKEKRRKRRANRRAKNKGQPLPYPELVEETETK